MRQAAHHADRSAGDDELNDLDYVVVIGPRATSKMREWVHVAVKDEGKGDVKVAPCAVRRIGDVLDKADGLRRCDLRRGGGGDRVE